MAKPTAPTSDTSSTSPSAKDGADKAETKEPKKSAAGKAAPAKTPTKATDKTGPKAKASDKSTGRSSSVPGGGAGKPSESAAAQESNEDAKGGGGLKAALVMLVGIAIVAAGAYATKAVWLPSVQPYFADVPGFAPAPEPEPQGPSPIDVLTDRLAALEQKLSAEPEDTTSETMAALNAERARLQSELDTALTRIGDLEKRLTEVRDMAQALTSTASGAEVDLSPVMSRIDSIEEAGRQTNADLAALSERVDSGLAANAAASAGGGASAAVLAIAQLRDAALAGQPFSAQIDALRALVGDRTEVVAALSRLQDSAATGLPTADALAAQFSGLAGEMLALARTGDGDWLDQAAGRLSSLVSIRRTDGQSGDPLEDAVAGIEARLAARDIPGAVDLASPLADSLRGGAREMLEPWLLDAKARASAERALNALQTAALAGFGG